MGPHPLITSAVSALLLLSHCALAAPVGPTLTAPATSGPTPASVIPPRPPVLPLQVFAPRFPELVRAARAPNDTALVVARRMLEGVDGEGLEKRAARQSRVAVSPQVQALIAQTCLDSSVNDTYISSLFYYGGAGTTVNLCPNAQINITNAIFFWAANQTLQTLGSPTGSTRATIRIAGPAGTVDNISCAIYGAIDNTPGIALRSVQVDGSRPALGIIWGGLALIEMGGSNTNQLVQNVRAFEPRGWSCLHVAEGAGLSCSGTRILNNQIGPSGHAPSGAQQFRKKRDSTGTYTPGQWADGISLACKNSVVKGNTITDATDGGIVVFGAPGSLITGNTIISDDRQLLGGINMVDWAPFGGSFVGTEVSGNSIVSKNSMIKLGIAIGVLSWGVDNRTIARTYGGTVKNNLFSSGPKGYFGYSVSAAGAENVTISGNSATLAKYGGVESSSCFTYWFPLPPPQPWIADQYTTPGCSVQKGTWRSTTWVLPICRGPNPS